MQKDHVSVTYISAPRDPRYEVAKEGYELRVSAAAERVGELNRTSSIHRWNTGKLGNWETLRFLAEKTRMNVNDQCAHVTIFPLSTVSPKTFRYGNIIHHMSALIIYSSTSRYMGSLTRFHQARTALQNSFRNEREEYLTEYSQQGRGAIRGFSNMVNRMRRWGLRKVITSREHQGGPSKPCCRYYCGARLCNQTFTTARWVSPLKSWTLFKKKRKKAGWTWCTKPGYVQRCNLPAPLLDAGPTRLSKKKTVIS
ncbi:hypothetical protein F4778DRAFT_120302 [Xylariomycetidae sp. FL2044]|nr:hypothetical protein F4778DRAFT_120302 [Xylariomycetidae sp. FL2044]